VGKSNPSYTYKHKGRGWVPVYMKKTTFPVRLHKRQNHPQFFTEIPVRGHRIRKKGSLERHRFQKPNSSKEFSILHLIPGK